MKNWEKEIDHITQQFLDEFKELDSNGLNWKPNSQTWSIGQIIDHIIVINGTYFPVIDAVRKGNYKLPFVAKFGFVVNLLGRVVLKGVQPGQQKKTRTFSIWEPTSSTVTNDIIDEFVQHQSALKKVIRTSKDLVKRGTIISSPANKNIVYKLETAFDIIVAHEARHLQQAMNVHQMHSENRINF